jgi:hypothetical protein
VIAAAVVAAVALVVVKTDLSNVECAMLPVVRQVHSITSTLYTLQWLVLRSSILQ